MISAAASIFGVDEFGIAHLHDTRQSQAHFVDEFRPRLRAGLGHDDFHAVIHLDEFEVRHFRVTEKLIAPGLLAVAGVPMQDTDVRRVRGVFEKVEPIVVGVAHRLDLPLAAAVDQRRIIRQRRWIVPIRSHVGEDQSAQLSHRIG